MTRTDLAAARAYLRDTTINRRTPTDLRPDPTATEYFATAFARLVRRRFNPATPIAEISRTVGNAAQRHAPVVLPPLETEMLIRDALGEPVPVDDIPPDLVVIAHVLMFASLADELALTDGEIDEVLALT
jgi:hypothetical protein